MSIETADRYQKAVLWARSGLANDGRVTLDSPVEIDVRWQEGKDVRTSDRSGVIEYDVLAIVNQDITSGSIVWLGELDDLPDSPTNLYEVKRLYKTPDIKGRNYRRTIGCMRFNSTLPDLA